MGGGRFLGGQLRQNAGIGIEIDGSREPGGQIRSHHALTFPHQRGDFVGRDQARRRQAGTGLSAHGERRQAEFLPLGVEGEVEGAARERSCGLCRKALQAADADQSGAPCMAPSQSDGDGDPNARVTPGAEVDGHGIDLRPLHTGLRQDLVDQGKGARPTGKIVRRLDEGANAGFTRHRDAAAERGELKGQDPHIRCAVYLPEARRA